MSATIPWFNDVLRKLVLRRPKTNYFTADDYRLRLGRSGLVERMHAASNALNSQGDQRLLYEQVFFQPHLLVCRYVFDREHSECMMSLAILSSGPTVVFSRAKANPLLAGIRRGLGYRLELRKESRVCHLLIDPAAVTDADVQRWFTYLLSGLRYSFKPGNRIFRPKSS